MTDPLQAFTPLFREWFRDAFPEPTPAQAAGWPVIQAGEHALLVSPTGSGKTLAAFYACLDDLYRRLTADEAHAPGVHTLYVSPLKALNNDVHRNLRVPLTGLEGHAKRLDAPWVDVETAVRTGDTPQRERARMTRKPPHVLITTPESLHLLLLAKGSRRYLRNVRYVIVDEVHALAASKRGAHLALNLERLSALQEDGDPVRVGLSATVNPVQEVARWLAGTRREARVLDAGRAKTLDLSVVSPVADFTDLEGESVWHTLYPKLFDVVNAHGTTIVFTNNRRLAERVSARLNALEVDPDAPPELSMGVPKADVLKEPVVHEGRKRQFLHEFVRAHHGSMSRDARVEMESLLKDGQLRGLVATSSLELGIDVGHVDCVALLGSPKRVTSGLQRVGRSGHVVGETAKGVFFPLHREDLVESAVLARAMRDGDVEALRVPVNALDVLAQQVVAHVAAEARPSREDASSADEDAGVPVRDLLHLVRGAYPYRDLPERAFHEVLEMLAGKYPARDFRNLAPRLSWDRERGALKAMPSAKHLATRNPGTIPDRGYYGCYLASDGTTKLGDLDEEFVAESRVGDVFLLGSQTWRIVDVDRDRVLVTPAPGEPPRMPFWRGEGVWRDAHLSARVARFRRDVEARLDDADAPAWLAREFSVDESAATGIIGHFQRMRDAVGGVPSDKLVVAEAFTDEIGDPRVVVHAPLGGRVMAAWSLAVAARLRERLNADVQALPNDDGFILRFPDVNAPPSPEDVLRLVSADDVEDVILQEIGDAPVFAARFRENAERALLLPRSGGGRRTPLWLQRLRAQDLLDVARRHPEFPVIVETYRDVLSEVLDVDALKRVLREVESGRVRVRGVSTDTPSPFAQGLLFQFTGAYLYEGDKTRRDGDGGAPSLDRGLLDEVLGNARPRDLLRADAIADVEAQLQRTHPERRARSPEELLHVLQRVGALPRDAAQARATKPDYVDRALADGRAVTATFPDGEERVVVAEDADLYARAWRGDARAVEGVVTRALAAHGPVTVDEVAAETGVPVEAVTQALKALESEGIAIAGAFRAEAAGTQWCDRDNLARVRKRTLTRLREEVAPVPFEAFARFLLHWHGLDAETPPSGGVRALRELVERLEGLALPGDAWEGEVLAPRFKRWDAKWMSPLTESGDVTWVGADDRRRFRPVLRSRAGLFVADEAPAREDATEAAVVDALRTYGACHFADLRAATRLDGARLTDALLRLVLAGVVTNDNFNVIRHAFRARPDTTPTPRSADDARAVPATYPRRPRDGARRARAASGPFTVGRWALVRTPLRLGPALDAPSRALAVAHVLLRRYGVVTREVADREGILPWAEISRALKRLEMQGAARRGLFVEGLSGLQFALPEAVHALRAARDVAEDAPLILVSAVDPGNAFSLDGAPELRDVHGEPARAPRTVGTHHAVKHGRVILVSERYGARVTRARDASDDDVIAALRAVAALAERPAGARARNRVTVEAFDGGPPTREGPRQLLAAAGFEADGGRMTAWPTYG